MIHSFHGAELIALEIDHSNLQDDRVEEVKSSLFLLDRMQKVRHLWKEPGDKNYSFKVISLHHNLTNMSFR